MKSVLKVYQYCNDLSLDVALGAVICAAFFARAFHVQLRPYGLASLGLTVWIIYTADHLLDAARIKQQASSKRHRFHQQYFKVLLMGVVVAALVDFVLIFFVRRPILNWGIGLSTVVLLYLLFQNRLKPFKELVVSLLYSAGVLLPALSLTETLLSLTEIVFISIFGITAFINLVLFSWYDWQVDLTDKHSSLVTSVGRNKVKYIMFGLFAVQAVLLSNLAFNSFYVWEAIILLAMNLPLLMLLLWPSHFSNESKYRMIGDVVFMIPVLYLL